VPILWLYAEHGIALEAHQLNTLVVVNAGGWPVGGRFRTSRAVHLAASRATDFERWAPCTAENVDWVIEDAFADELLGYHLGADNLMGLIGAFGSQGLADEHELLSDLRGMLTRFAARKGPVPTVISALLDSPTIRCAVNTGM